MKLRPVTMILAALSLSACGVGGSIVHYQQFYGTNNERLFGLISSRGPLPVEVYGNPFAENPEQFARRVVDAMEGHDAHDRFDFEPAGTVEPNGVYRAVMTFADSASGGPGSVCEPAVRRGSPSQSTIANAGPSALGTSVIAAFCEGESVVGVVSGSRADVAGSQSPEFQDLMAQVTRSLFPLNVPMDTNDDRRRFCWPFCI